MAKRKRVSLDAGNSDQAKNSTTENTLLASKSEDTLNKKRQKRGPENGTNESPKLMIQIIIGSYEKILHGFTAEISISASTGVESDDTSDAHFTENFLFNAHGSAIRCLALSPSSASSDVSLPQKKILATGGSDATINLYHISTVLVSPNDTALSVPSIAGEKVIENPRNKELGSLHHHDSSINALFFPTRSKLLSAAEDNTIGVTRTRDWTVLSTIKAPIPKSKGRPSGDTNSLRGNPSGINDFAIHPSMKLMVSVGKGEKCMRLWNLVTGKKAGALNFDKEMIQSFGEGQWSSGEGRKVEWNNDGDEFAVGFEKGVAVFGIVCSALLGWIINDNANRWYQDSKLKCRIVPSPSTKIHQMHYIDTREIEKERKTLLALSTEDGRILFYDTKTSTPDEAMAEVKFAIPMLKPVGQIGGIHEEVGSRIKDFEILCLASSETSKASLFVIAGSSDGTVRLWRLDWAKFAVTGSSLSDGGSANITRNQDISQFSEKRFARLVGTYETGNRIICLKAFIMSGSKMLNQ